MLFRSTLDGRPFTLVVRPGSVTASIDTSFVVASDDAGRLYSVYRDGHTFRRGLNGRVLHKWQDEAGRHWEWLDDRASDALVDDARTLFSRALDLARLNHWEVPDGKLANAAGFDAARARADAAEFARIYDPIGILPPDHYLSLVLQATTGCSFNSCTFCDLYHDAYRVKTPEEFEAHARRVLSWHGGSLALRRRAVFLGAANALAVPSARLLQLFLVIAALVAPVGGVSAFVDGFTGVVKSAAEYQALRDAGLRRVYLGLESGHDPLLAFVRKPATRDGAVATARAITGGGVRLAVIVMVGLGGRAFVEAHVRDTAAALNEMGLRRGDLVYFSDLVELPQTAYPRLAAEAGIVALTATERRAQRDAIVRGLRFAGDPPRVANYDVREFVY